MTQEEFLQILKEHEGKKPTNIVKLIPDFLIITSIIIMGLSLFYDLEYHMANFSIFLASLVLIVFLISMTAYLIAISVIISSIKIISTTIKDTDVLSYFAKDFVLAICPVLVIKPGIITYMKKSLWFVFAIILALKGWFVISSIALIMGFFVIHYDKKFKCCCTELLDQLTLEQLEDLANVIRK